jgi:hypothetical protein
VGGREEFAKRSENLSAKTQNRHCSGTCQKLSAIHDSPHPLEIMKA